MLFQGFYVERIRNMPICNHSFSPSLLRRMNIIYFFIVFVRCKRRVDLFGYLFFIVYRLDSGCHSFGLRCRHVSFKTPHLSNERGDDQPLVSDEPVKLEK